MRVTNRFAAGTLDGVEADVDAVLREVEVVEVAIEALADAPPAVKHERADETASAIAARAEHPGERHLVIAQIEAAVVANAVVGGKRAGHAVTRAPEASAARPSWPG